MGLQKNQKWSVKPGLNQFVTRLMPYQKEQLQMQIWNLKLGVKKSQEKFVHLIIVKWWRDQKNVTIKP